MRGYETEEEKLNAKFDRLVKSFEYKFNHILTEDDIKIVRFSLAMKPIYKRDNLHSYLYDLMMYALRESEETLEWCLNAVYTFLSKSSRDKCTGNLENFILRYGNLIGNMKYKERNAKTAKSLENYIIRLGEVEGVKKYNEYISKLGKPKKIEVKIPCLQGKDLVIANYEKKNSIILTESEIEFIKKCFDYKYDKHVRSHVFTLLSIAHRLGNETLEWCLNSFYEYQNSLYDFKTTPSLDVYILRYGKILGESYFVEYKTEIYCKLYFKKFGIIFSSEEKYLIGYGLHNCNLECIKDFLYDVIINVYRIDNKSVEYCLDSIKTYISCDFRQKIVRSLENCVMRYGEKLGKEKFEAVGTQNKKDLNSLIKKHGEQKGTMLYESHVNRDRFSLVIENYENNNSVKFTDIEVEFIKQCFSHEVFTLRHNGRFKIFIFELILIAHRLSGEDYEFINNSFKMWADEGVNFGANTLENMNARYGRKVGTEKFELMVEQKSEESLYRNSMEYFIETHGEQAEEKYREFKESITHSLETYMKKYGEVEGTAKYTEFKEKLKKSSLLCKEYYLKRGHSIEESTILAIQANHEKNYIHVHGKASKESMLVFYQVIDYLTEIGILKEDIFVGIEGSREHRIKTKKCLFLYDFTIMSLKLIIEFHGVKYHVKEKYGVLQYDNTLWIHDKEKALLKYERDCLKIQTANDRGFKVLVIWSDVKVSENLELCKQFILENI